MKRLKLWRVWLSASGEAGISGCCQQVCVSHQPLPARVLEYPTLMFLMIIRKVHTLLLALILSLQNEKMVSITSVEFFSIEGKLSENVRWPGGEKCLKKVSKFILSVTSLG